MEGRPPHIRTTTQGTHAHTPKTRTRTPGGEVELALLDELARGLIRGLGHLCFWGGVYLVVCMGALDGMGWDGWQAARIRSNDTDADIRLYRCTTHIDWGCLTFAS
jgi:hypothetical protein